MDADYDIFEIAAVIRDFWLVDAESYQRKYSTKHGKPLAVGYYVVNWPEHIRARRFNEHAAFHGPFKTRSEAQAALDWMYKEWQRVTRDIYHAFSNDGKGAAKSAIQGKRATEDRKSEQTDWGWGGWKPWITGFPPPVARKNIKITIH